MQRYIYNKLHFIALTLSSLLTGCMVGPNFQPPTSPATQSYTSAPLPQKTANSPATGKAGRSQYFVNGQDIPASWWTLYHSPELNQLITTGLANNPTLDAAKATLRQTQETLQAQVGNLLFPAVNAQLGAQRERFSGASFGSDNAIPSSIFNLYNAGVNVSYTLDMFGASRRQVEAAQAQVNYQFYELSAAYLTLTANITTTAITTAALQAQIQATQGLVLAEAEQLAIIRKQYQLGSASEENLLSQQTQLEQTQALLPPLQQSLSQAKHALAVLVGSLPSESNLPNIDLKNLVLPAQLPISVPSNLVRQRPDIQASEALLKAASAQVGVATANLFPQITLNGNYGWASAVPSTLFQPANLTWNIGAGLLQPIFHGAALQAQRQAAIDAYQAADAQYRQTVLQAFQNVADSLRALEHDAQELQAQQRAETAAKRNLVLTRQQYRLGGASYLAILSAEQQYQQTLVNRIQAEAARYIDTAALFQALGGGWWNTPLALSTVNSVNTVNAVNTANKSNGVKK